MRFSDLRRVGSNPPSRRLDITLRKGREHIGGPAGLSEWLRRGSSRRRHFGILILSEYGFRRLK